MHPGAAPAGLGAQHRFQTLVGGQQCLPPGTGGRPASGPATLGTVKPSVRRAFQDPAAPGERAVLDLVNEHVGRPVLYSADAAQFTRADEQVVHHFDVITEA